MTQRTDRQKEVYDFILSYKKEKGTLPTKREIQRHFEFKSYNAAYEVVNTLIKKGWLEDCDNSVKYKVV